MGYMDSMSDQPQDMSEMRDRYNELRNKEMRGELDDAGRQELQQLRSQMQDMGE